jgi:cysteine desulfurase
LERIDGCGVNGSGVERTPNTVNFRFESVDGHELVMALDAAGYAVSTGAACDTGGTGSHVLTGMGLSPEAVRGSVRVSLGRYTGEVDIRDFSEALEVAVKAVRAKSSFAKAR